MKILYLLEDGRLGGMAKMILQIAAGVRSKETEVQIIIGEQNSDSLISIASKLNLKVKLLRLRFLSKAINQLLAYAFYFVPDMIKMIRELKTIAPDIVYCNGSQQIKGVIAARLFGIKVIWHMHDTYQPKPILWLFKAVTWVFGVRNFVASSKRTIAFYSLPIEKTLLSIPPVDTNEFTPTRNHGPSLPKASFNIISVANINPDKGIDTLIYTAAKVSAEVDGVNFSIVGLIPETQKELFNQLTKLKDTLGLTNIKFLGQRTDIKEILANSDLYLCSSNNESGPISVFEAMAMGLPVVSTDVGDLKEIFESNNSGITQQVGDSKALSESIIKLLKNSAELRLLGERGRETALSHLDIKNTISKHLKFYQSILS